jgi:GTPase SAR1 family protein
MQKSQKSVKEYDEKEMGIADLKIIILGDSAVGKSK